MSDPIQRFSTRAAAYARFRPQYPATLVDAIVHGLGLRPGGRVAELGAGTGIFSARLLERGLEVVAVEPDADCACRSAWRWRGTCASAHRRRSSRPTTTACSRTRPGTSGCCPARSTSRRSRRSSRRAASRRAFDAHQRGGRVTMQYGAHLFIGRSAGDRAA